MSSTQQLWAPLSIRIEHSARLSQKQASEYLESFLSAPGGGLSDQNTIASLLRLQTGLRDELQRPSNPGASKQAKSLKRKHDKVSDGKDSQAAGTAGDVTIDNMGDDVAAAAAASEEPKTKKKRKQKKSTKPDDE